MSKQLRQSVKEAYDNISNEYGGFYKRKIFQNIIKEFLQGTKGNVLDIGSADAKSLYFDNKKYFGLDISFELLKRAKKKYTKLVNGDMVSLPFKSESFDNIICIASLHHLDKEDQKKAIKEINRILKKSGKVMLTVWYRYQKKFLPAAIWSNKTYVYFGKFKRYYYLFTKKEIVNLITSSGFEIKELQVTKYGKSGRHRNIILIAEKIKNV